MDLQKVMHELLTDHEHLTVVRFPENEELCISREGLINYYCLKAKENGKKQEIREE